MASAEMSAADIFIVPFFLNEKDSPRVIRSSPRNILIIGFLRRATGTNAAALMPTSPSESQSTHSPLAKAASMHPIVPVLMGMQRIIAGKMESMT